MAQASRANQPIRKVWVPREMKVAVRELCWQNRTKPSPYIAGIIHEIIEHPQGFEDAAVPPAGLDYLSVYISDDEWNKGLAVAEQYRVRLSALVRVAIARDLTKANIPWDVTTTRPRNDHIPTRE